jgi:mevalonate kinase
MKKVSYSAPVKVILSGEHAVVYGKPALVCAIDRRLAVTVIEGESDNTDPSVKEIVLIVKRYLKGKKIPLREKKCRISIGSDIPVGRGLGSSGALSVAAAASLMDFFTGVQHSLEEINNCAYQIEKLFHKNPSGVDPTTSCFGGLIFYRKEFEFLKTISSLHAKIPKKIAQNIYLVDSGKPGETTAEMVQQIGGLYNDQSTYMEEIFQRVERVTKRMVVSLIKEDGKFFGETVAENEELLEKMGAVSPSAIKLLKALRQFGVGKITGAGGRKKGSGYILFYTERGDTLVKYLKKKSTSFLSFNPSPDGVKKMV